MRKENYLIALINKDLLNLRLPLPFLRPKLVVTKTIEWGLSFALFNYIFDEHNAVKHDVLSISRHERMAKRCVNNLLLLHANFVQFAQTFHTHGDCQPFSLAIYIYLLVSSFLL